MFADKPGFVARQMLLALVPDPLRWSVGCAYADGGKAGFELAFRPGSPTHSLPLGSGQHDSGRFKKNIWHIPPSRAAPFGNGPISCTPTGYTFR